jgi:uncharacterized damage-inducible protein DinB
VNQKSNIMPNYKDLLIPELKHEVALTEKFIRRIPADKMDWKAHEKSFTLRELANHLANVLDWIPATMNMDVLSLDDNQSPNEATIGQILDNLHKNAKAAMAALDKENEVYQQTWTMKRGDQVLLSMPRYQVLRGMVLNQLPHHRAQLGVYLRLLDVAVPATYGPSADEAS